jgi:hypothetical protein
VEVLQAEFTVAVSSGGGKVEVLRAEFTVAISSGGWKSGRVLQLGGITVAVRDREDYRRRRTYCKLQWWGKGNLVKQTS